MWSPAPASTARPTLSVVSESPPLNAPPASTLIKRSTYTSTASPATFGGFGKPLPMIPSARSPAGVVACTVAGERADGIIGSGFPKPPKVAGDAVDVYVERLIKVEAGGAFNGGDSLTTDNVGRAVLAGAGDHINAIATEPATAAGQIVGARAPYSRGPSSGVSVVNAPLAPALAASGAAVVIAI